MRLVRVVTNAALTTIHALLDLGEQIINLPPRWFDLYGRIKKARRSNNLFNNAVADLMLIGAGGGRHEDNLTEKLLEFRVIERPVIQRGGEAETVINQDLLAGDIAVEHAAELWDGHVRLIDKDEVVLGEVVEERPRTATWASRRWRWRE